jgi:long-chain fatty acid transport protein
MISATLCWTFLPPAIYAEGFRNQPPGAFNLGRAGGRIAQIDDSSAVTQNPANLIDLKDAEVQLTPSIVYFAADYESPIGAKTHTVSPWKFLPNVFGAAPIKDNTLAAGLGITVPYGISNEWDPSLTSPFRYTAPHFTELKTVNINPTVSVRLCRTVTFGAGLDVMWSELDIRQFYPWFVGFGLGNPDGEARIRGDGFGYGGNVGLTWQVADRHRVAVTYRSPMTIHYNGHFSIDNIPAAAAGFGATSRSPFSSRIQFPTIVAAGYGFQVTDTIRLEADLEWLQFSNFDTLNLNVGNNAFLFPSTNFRQSWKDTFTAGFGGDWRFSPRWTLRAGYQYYQSPVPDNTFSPTIPDANQNVLTVGLAYKHKHHAAEIAYGLDFYDQRNITANQNPAFNGKYDLNVHLFSMAYRYSF